MSRFCVTTPIYYVNDKPHLGHAYTTLCADVLARFYRLKYGDKNVFFLTGTDEHGAKVQQSAEAAGLTPLEFVEKTSQSFKDAWSKLNIKYDYFIRTSDPQHEKVVQDLLKRIYDKGYIYAGEYEGLYCVGCEKFLQSDDLVDGVCPLHPNQKPVAQKEKNYFFKLSEFGDKLLKALEKGEYKIVPAGRHKEIIGKIKQGLEDISISRAGVSWGVKVPWDESQTVYVWVDALINYYSATQFVDGKKEFWPADVHLLAKDILWFHAVIWEALLLAAELPLPKVIATHGFFTIDGQKMSKSLGNAIDPLDLIKEFGVEATRYLLLSQVPFEGDGDVSLTRFRERYESDLANGLGNIVVRLTDMIEKFGIIWPSKKVDKSSLLSDSLDLFNFAAPLQISIGKITGINQTIQQQKPWELFKAGNAKEVQNLLGELANELLHITYLIESYMPETVKAIQQTLMADKITKAAPLFPRLNKN